MRERWRWQCRQKRAHRVGHYQSDRLQTEMVSHISEYTWTTWQYPYNTRGDRSTRPTDGRITPRNHEGPLYEKIYWVAKLAALDCYIEGCESYSESGISIGNLMMREDGENPFWQSSLIDIDLAIKEQQNGKRAARLAQEPSWLEL